MEENDEDFNEYLKILILSNYMEALKRKDIKSLSEWKNDSIFLKNFLFALGASKEMIVSPAHCEQLKSCLKDIMDSLIEAVRDEEMGYSFKYLEKGLEATTEDVKMEEKFSLEFNKDAYNFQVSRNIGEKLKRVSGNTTKQKIICYSEYLNFLETNNIIIEKTLDESGFVVEEDLQRFSNEENIQIKKRREDQNIFIGENKIRWNGNTAHLNEESGNAKVFLSNMSRVLEEYPQTQEYYESIVGEDIVRKTLEMINKSKEE